MGKMLLRVKCGKCGRRLVDFEQGGKPGQVKIQSYDFTLLTGKLAQKIGIAKCSKCGGETEFDAQYLPIPAGKLH